MSRKYVLKIPRFQPYKNIYVGVDFLVKICTKCGQHKQLNYENYCKDSQREYGFQSQCRECKRIPSKEYNRRKRNESRSKAR